MGLRPGFADLCDLGQPQNPPGTQVPLLDSGATLHSEELSTVLGTWLPPASLEAHGNHVPWFSEETLLSPYYPPPPPPTEPWWCLSWSQVVFSRRHKNGTSSTWAPCSQPPARRRATAGSASGRRVLAVPLSLGRRALCVAFPPRPSFRTPVTRARPPRPRASSHSSAGKSHLHTFACAGSPARCQPHFSICLKLPFLKMQRCQLHFKSPL